MMKSEEIKKYSKMNTLQSPSVILDGRDTTISEEQGKPVRANRNKELAQPKAASNSLSLSLSHSLTQNSVTHSLILFLSLSPELWDYLTIN